MLDRSPQLWRTFPPIVASRSTKPGTATARQRRYRARLRGDQIVAPVIVGHAVVGMLIDLHWITPADSEDRRAIGRAIAALLAEAARR